MKRWRAFAGWPVSSLHSYYKFLAACLSEPRDGQGEDLLRQTTAAEWDWQQLIRLAAAERILPSLYGRFESLGVLQQLPADVLQFFRTLRDLSLERNEALLEEVKTVALLLNSVGIEPVVLKGVAYLITGVYRERSGRYLSDIDLLVPPTALMTCVEVLRNHGYREEREDPFASVRHHYTLLRRPLQPGAGIELHQRLGLGASRRMPSGPEIIAESQVIELDGARVRIPCPTHLVLHQFIHSQIHHGGLERIWPSLRTMYDLALLLRRFASEIDWAAFECRFRRARQHGSLILYFHIAAETIGLPRPFHPERAMEGLTRFRWQRRRLLRRRPGLLRVDPIYVFSSSVLWRLQHLTEVVGRPGGWSYVWRNLRRLRYYRKLLDEIGRRPEWISSERS